MLDAPVDFDFVLRGLTSSETGRKRYAFYSFRADLQIRNIVFQADVLPSIIFAVKQAINHDNAKLSMAGLDLLGPLMVEVQRKAPGMLNTVIRELCRTLIGRLTDVRRSLEMTRDVLVKFWSVAFSLEEHEATASTSAGLLEFLKNEFKNAALGHESWKVREQAILLLIRCVRQIPEFMIRPFTLNLIDMLEDPSEVVRETSKRAIVTLFGKAPARVRADVTHKLQDSRTRKVTVDDIFKKLGSTDDHKYRRVLAGTFARSPPASKSIPGCAAERPVDSKKEGNRPLPLNDSKSPAGFSGPQPAQPAPRSMSICTRVTEEPLCRKKDNGRYDDQANHGMSICTSETEEPLCRKKDDGRCDDQANHGLWSPPMRITSLPQLFPLFQLPSAGPPLRPSQFEQEYLQWSAAQPAPQGPVDGKKEGDRPLPPNDSKSSAGFSGPQPTRSAPSSMSICTSATEEPPCRKKDDGRCHDQANHGLCSPPMRITSFPQWSRLFQPPTLRRPSQFEQEYLQWCAAPPLSFSEVEQSYQWLNLETPLRSPQSQQTSPQSNAAPQSYQWLNLETPLRSPQFQQASPQSNAAPPLRSSQVQQSSPQPNAAPPPRLSQVQQSSQQQNSETPLRSPQVQQASQQSNAAPPLRPSQVQQSSQQQNLETPLRSSQVQQSDLQSNAAAPLRSSQVQQSDPQSKVASPLRASQVQQSSQQQNLETPLRSSQVQQSSPQPNAAPQPRPSQVQQSSQQQDSETPLRSPQVQQASRQLNAAPPLRSSQVQKSSQQQNLGTPLRSSQVQQSSQSNAAPPLHTSQVQQSSPQSNAAPPLRSSQVQQSSQQQNLETPLRSPQFQQSSQSKAAPPLRVSQFHQPSRPLTFGTPLPSALGKRKRLAEPVAQVQINEADGNVLQKRIRLPREPPMSRSDGKPLSSSVGGECGNVGSVGSELEQKAKICPKDSESKPDSCSSLHGNNPSNAESQQQLSIGQPQRLNLRGNMSAPLAQKATDSKPRGQQNAVRTPVRCGSRSGYCMTNIPEKFWKSYLEELEKSVPLPSTLGKRKRLLAESVEQVRNGEVDQNLFRKMIRLSCESQVSGGDRCSLSSPAGGERGTGGSGSPDGALSQPADRVAVGVWEGGMFTECVEAVIAFFSRPMSNDNKRNCLFLLQALVQNQASYVSGYEQAILTILLDCHADMNLHVCSAARMTLATFLEYADKNTCMEALQKITDTNLGGPWRDVSFTLKDLGDTNVLRAPQPATAFRSLEKILHRYDTLELEVEIPKLTPLIMKGILHQSVHVRRRSAEAFFTMQEIIGSTLPEFESLVQAVENAGFQFK